MFINHILDITWKAADNATVWDATGKNYIDFTSGIFAANIGHNNPYVNEAIVKYKHLLHSYTFNTEVRERYIAELCEFTGFEDAALFSSGTEACEAAWKIARLSTGKLGVWGMPEAFHGKTLGAQIMANKFGSPHYAQPRDKTGMMIMEPYTAHTAAFHKDKQMAFVRGVQNDGILLTLDEIQAGFGRTGKLFGFQHYDYLEPDFVCIGKGMGNGFPISGLLGPKHLISDPFFDLSSTHGGNPLACAVGLAVINYFKDRQILKKAEEKGRVLHELLEKLPVLTAGKGLVAALWFDSVTRADDFVKMAAERGLLVVHTGRETVKLAPPLTIPEAQLDVAGQIIKDCVEKIML